MAKRKPTPKPQRKIVEETKDAVELPAKHPHKFGIKESLTFKIREPKILRNERKLLNRLPKEESPRVLNVLLAISTYNRPKHLQRCLDSLKRCLRPDVKRHLEVLVTDDESPQKDLEIIINAVKDFTQLTGCPVTLWPGKERLGRSRNKK